MLQVSRVTKVVKGGKVMSFRAVVAVGDDKGRVRPFYCRQCCSDALHSFNLSQWQGHEWFHVA